MKSLQLSNAHFYCDVASANDRELTLISLEHKEVVRDIDRVSLQT